MKKGILNNSLYTLIHTWKYEKRIIFSILIQIILGVVLPIAGVFLPTLVVASISDGLNYGMVVSVFSILLFLLVVNTLTTYLSNLHGTYLLNNKIGFLSALFKKKMKVDYSYIESAEGQTAYENAFMSILNDHTGVSGMLSVIGPLFSSIIGICINIGTMFRLNMLVVAVLLLTSFIHIYIAYLIRTKQGKLQEPVADNSRKLNYLFGYTSGQLGAREIRIFNMYDWMKQVIGFLIKDRVNLAKKSAGYTFYLSIVDCIILAFRDAVAYIFAIAAIQREEIAVWELVMYLGTITCASSFFSSLTSNLALMGQRSAEINVIREFLDKETNEEGAGILPDENTGLKIEIKDVSFKFREEDEYILRDINLTISTNQKLAIVGENGSGKSTLVKIICGLYRPTEGAVLVNGINLNEINLQAYQKLIATAFQDTYLLPMTVGENVAFGEAESLTGEIKECIKLAGLDEKDWEISKPLTKMLTTSGLIPSGGQMQKIILARVAFKLLFRGAALLILDEPTSAMDAIAEKEFYDRYLDLAKNKSCILVSHRMKSTNTCDLIVVMNNGSITERGTHSELMQANGLYRKMYDLQSSYYQ
jgi:ABC-type multidrug transport system fused ATPase/permease subunit